MLYEHISKNKRRTITLLIVFFLLLSVIGFSIGYVTLDSGIIGVVISSIVGIIYMAVMLFNSSKVVMKMNHARKITKEEIPSLYHIVEDMAMVAQIPCPDVYLIEDESMNAFATGSKPENSAVAVTSGLLNSMNREELEGVIGHEISHIKNYDIRVSTIAVALSSAIVLLSNIAVRSLRYGGKRKSKNNSLNGIILIIAIITIILGPIVATLIQLAISREREYLADASSVELTRNPYGMISALRKLSTSSPMKNEVDNASAALYITNPLNNEKVKGLLRTHPPIEDRIKRLEKS